MDTPRFSLLSPALFLALATPALGAGGDIVVDAGRGPVTVHVPASYDAAVPAPLLLLLHRFAGSGAEVANYFGIDPVAEQLGFLYLHPDGSTNAAGQRFWNATDVCCDFNNSGIDDSTYLRDLIDAVKLELNVDPARVHVAGHSNGGFMTYRLACDHSPMIASIASLAGLTFFDPADCAPELPLHVLQMHGTADATFNYGGGIFGGSPYPSAEGSAVQWASFGGCSAVSSAGAPLDLVASIAGSETTVKRYESNCTPRSSAELWTMVGAGHIPALGASFAAEVVGWLDAHPKPTFGTSYCTASDHSGGRAASIVVTGSASVADEDLQLIGFGAPAGNVALFIASQTQDQVVFGDGFLCVGGSIQRIGPPLVTTAGGEAYRSLDFTANYAPVLVAGTQVNFQLWFRDSAGSAGFNTSAGYGGMLVP